MPLIPVKQVEPLSFCEEIASRLIRKAESDPAATGVVDVRAVFRFNQGKQHIDADNRITVNVDGSDFHQVVLGRIDTLHRIRYPHMDSVEFVRLM